MKTVQDYLQDELTMTMLKNRTLGAEALCGIVEALLAEHTAKTSRVNDDPLDSLETLHG